MANIESPLTLLLLLFCVDMLEGAFSSSTSHDIEATLKWRLTW